MKSITPTLILLCYFTNLHLCFTQGGVKAQNQPSFSLHYHAFNYFHVGVELGYENSLLGIEKTNKKDRTRWYQIYYGPSLGIYNYRGNHTGITLGTDLGFKTIGANGLELELFAGAHYLRTQNANETFEQTSNGSFEKVNGAGHNYFQYRLGLGVGKNFLPQGKPISINLKLGVSRVPMMPSPSITPNIWIGVNYYF